jgi:mitochondrial fission protein ELM1
MSFKKNFSCWILTEGAAGMLSQAVGLAESIGLKPIEQKKVILGRPWNFLPTGIIPLTFSVLDSKSDTLEEPWPDFIISCGRMSIIPSIIIKKKYSKKVITIHIQDPKINIKNFDFIICPEHDGLSGANVITTKGAIHCITPLKTANAANKNKSFFGDIEEKDILTVLLGGPNKYFSYSEVNLVNLITKLKKAINNNNNIKLIIVPSRRTPVNFIQKLKNELGENHFFLSKLDQEKYFASLELANYLLVTCDSTSLISEAISTGKPVFIEKFKTKRKSKRFSMFHDNLEKMNVVKEFNGELTSWSYKIIEDTKQVGETIRRKLGI